MVWMAVFAAFAQEPLPAPLPPPEFPPVLEGSGPLWNATAASLGVTFVGATLSLTGYGDDDSPGPRQWAPVTLAGFGITTTGLVVTPLLASTASYVENRHLRRAGVPTPWRAGAVATAAIVTGQILAVTAYAADDYGVYDAALKGSGICALTGGSLLLAQQFRHGAARTLGRRRILEKRAAAPEPDPVNPPSEPSSPLPE